MDVLERFSRGDLEAFEAIFRQFQGQVYGWTLRMVRDRATAEDLTIEAFWRMYRAHARFDPARSFGAWARRIAANVAFEHLKKPRHEEHFPEEYAGKPAADPVVQREVRDGIHQAFAMLPPKLRIVASLRLIEERPEGEVAEALGTSIGTVKSRAFRALRLLRKHLKRLGIEP